MKIHFKIMSGNLACALAILLAGNSPVFACACCGTDNTWLQQSESLSGYTYKLLNKLQFVSGSFDDAPAYEAMLDVQKVRSKKNRFVFKTEKGNLILSLSGRVQHRMSDITFITNKNYRYTDEADIYHELIIHGELQVPNSVANEFRNSKLRNKVKVNLVLQGVGNACIENPVLKKWLLKPLDESVVFSGSGKIK